MKALFICCGQKKESSNGIFRKIKSQVALLDRYGVDTELICIDNHMSLFDKFKFFLRFVKSSYEKRLISCIDNLDLSNYNLVYYRWATPSWGVCNLFEKIKKNNSSIKIIVELPTYPGLNEYKGVKKIILPLWSRPIIKRIAKHIDRIVTFSKDESIWHVPTIRLHNCVEFASIKKREPKINCFANRTIKLLSVSSNDFWHGYDRVITGLHNYYLSKKNKQIDVYYYCVGKGSQNAYYEKLVKKYGLEKHVFFCGSCYGEKLDELYSSCDLALDSIGRHRSGVNYNSSLKTKEYLAKGIPFVTSVDSELDEDKFPYMLKIPADNSPVIIDDVIEFVKKVYSKDNQQILSTKIRDFGIARYDYACGYKPLIDYLFNN